MGNHHHRAWRKFPYSHSQRATFPHSLGLLYTAFTAYCGFKVNSGEYKLMGLAPPMAMVIWSLWQDSKEKAICDTLVDIREDGSLLLNMEYFDYATGLRMYKRAKWEKLLGIPPRDAESESNGNTWPLRWLSSK